MPQPMKRLHNFLSLLVLVLKRLVHHAGLSLSSAVGIVSILSLVVCVPVFASGVLSQVLKEQLTEKANLNHRSLFSLHTYYADNETYTSLTVEKALGVSQFIQRQLEDTMGLRLSVVEMQVMTRQFAWKPVKFRSSLPANKTLSMSFMSNVVLPTKVTLVDGKWPQVESDAAKPIQAAVLED